MWWGGFDGGGGYQPFPGYGAPQGPGGPFGGGSPFGAGGSPFSGGIYGLPAEYGTGGSAHWGPLPGGGGPPQLGAPPSPGGIQGGFGNPFGGGFGGGTAGPSPQGAGGGIQPMPVVQDGGSQQVPGGASATPGGIQNPGAGGTQNVNGLPAHVGGVIRPNQRPGGQGQPGRDGGPVRAPGNGGNQPVARPRPQWPPNGGGQFSTGAGQGPFTALNQDARIGPNGQVFGRDPATNQFPGNTAVNKPGFQGSWGETATGAPSATMRPIDNIQDAYMSNQFDPNQASSMWEQARGMPVKDSYQSRLDAANYSLQDPNIPDWKKRNLLENRKRLAGLVGRQQR